VTDPDQAISAISAILQTEIGFGEFWYLGNVVVSRIGQSDTLPTTVGVACIPEEYLSDEIRKTLTSHLSRIEWYEFPHSQKGRFDLIRYLVHAIRDSYIAALPQFQPRVLGGGLGGIGGGVRLNPEEFKYEFNPKSVEFIHHWANGTDCSDIALELIRVNGFIYHVVPALRNRHIESGRLPIGKITNDEHIPKSLRQ
jgi:hypothetical protein